MKIARIDTRTISVSFVVWLLVNLVKRITIVTKKLKNCSINIVKISKWNQMNLKVSNWKIFIRWKIFMKYNSLP